MTETTEIIATIVVGVLYLAFNYIVFTMKE